MAKRAIPASLRTLVERSRAPTGSASSLETAQGSSDGAECTTCCDEPSEGRTDALEDHFFLAVADGNASPLGSEPDSSGGANCTTCCEEPSEGRTGADEDPVLPDVRNDSSQLSGVRSSVATNREDGPTEGRPGAAQTQDYISLTGARSTGPVTLETLEQQSWWPGSVVSAGQSKGAADSGILLHQNRFSVLDLDDSGEIGTERGNCTVVFDYEGNPLAGRLAKEHWEPPPTLAHPLLEVTGAGEAPTGAAEQAAKSRKAKAGAFGRIEDQMRKCHPKVGLPKPPPYPQLTDSAAYFKAAFLHLTQHDVSVPVPKVRWKEGGRDQFWARMSVNRTRFRGQKHDYMQVVTTGHHRRMLTLQAPGQRLTPEQEMQHALCQATYRDDVNDRYRPGQRLRDQAMHDAGFPLADLSRSLYGHALELLELPEQQAHKNHGSCALLPERHTDTMKATRLKGFSEGPLHYAPWVVNPMGGVYVEHKDKYRVVIDATTSGNNDAMTKLDCRLDDLRVVLPKIQKGAWLSGIDLSDAFNNWPNTQLDCEFWGIKDPTHGQYDRYRSQVFGSAQSPYVQQRWALLLKQKCNELGCKFVLSPKANANPAEAAGAYLDDFIIVHDPSLSKEEADEQFFSLVRLFTEWGLEVAPAKLEPPSKSKEYIGFLIDTEECTVGFTDQRRERMIGEIDSFVAQYGQASPEEENEEGLTVLDLFGGIGTCLHALAEAGQKVSHYYLVEVEPGKRKMAQHYANMVKAQFPDSFLPGALDDMFKLPQDVTELDLTSLRGLPKVDLLCAAWPCQGLSKANCGGGEGLRDHRSGLFWYAHNVLKELRARDPNVSYVFENVPFGDSKVARFKKDHQTVCKLLGDPLTFDASLVSPAHRVRSYWTNLPGLEAPAERKGCDWQDALDSDHTVPLDKKGVPTRKAPTVVKSANTWSERRGAALVWNVKRNQWEQMRIEERERLVGLLPGATAAPGADEAERRAACGDILDRHAFTHLLTHLPDRPQTSPKSGGRGVAPRRVLAKLIGKLQFAALIVHGGQAQLAKCYRARDAFVAPAMAAASVKRQWHKSVEVRLDDDTFAALAFWKTALADATRRVYLDDVECGRGVWAGEVSDTDSSLDQTSETSTGIPVITTDAAGDAGGGFWEHRRRVWPFPPHECAPVQSSNFRELATAILALEHWGPELQRRGATRVLLRTDNTVTMSVINKKKTRGPSLEQWLQRLLELERKYGLDVAARHIPGVDNTLADALSRWKPVTDRGDWQINAAAFREIVKTVGEPTVDAAADPVGTNSFCPRFWSELDSALKHDWAGERVYANCDFELAEQYIRHGLECYARDPKNTSLTFVLPVWFHRKYWRMLKGFRLAAFFPENTNLFTSPDWQGQHDLRTTRPRCNRGPTRFGVIVAHLPAAATVARRREPRRDGVHAAGNDRQCDPVSLPVLSGDPGRDAALLSGMQPMELPQVRGD